MTINLFWKLERMRTFFFDKIIENNQGQNLTF